MRISTILPLALFALPPAAALFLGGCGDNLTQPDPKKAYVTADPTPLTCVPNLDGKIDSAELAPSFDTPARFVVSPAGRERPVSVLPRVEGGKNIWDFSVDAADDQAATFTAQPIKGHWYEASFPANAFVVAFDAGGTTEAIYSHDQNALSLLGLASKVEAPAEGKTLLVYSTPISLYKFPLAPGATYTSIGESKNATLRGLPYAGKDTYEVKVDAAGEVDLPDLIFQQALRVRIKVTVEPAAGAVTTQRQVQFISECFGEITRFTSKNNEPNEDFTQAAEVRRFGLL